MRLYLLLVLAMLLGEGLGAWIMYEAKAHPAIEEATGLRAQVGALRAADGDASCAVRRNGPRVLCALRGDRLQHTALNDADVVCAIAERRSDRVTCRLADGREVALRRELTKRHP